MNAQYLSPIFLGGNPWVGFLSEQKETAYFGGVLKKRGDDIEDKSSNMPLEKHGGSQRHVRCTISWLGESPIYTPAPEPQIDHLDMSRPNLVLFSLVFFRDLSPKNI